MPEKTDSLPVWFLVVIFANSTGSFWQFFRLPPNLNHDANFDAFNLGEAWRQNLMTCCKTHKTVLKLSSWIQFYLAQSFSNSVCDVRNIFFLPVLEKKNAIAHPLL